jgi:hypothetical protein
MANKALYVSAASSDATVLAETSTPLTSLPGNPNFTGTIITALLATAQSNYDDFFAARADSVYGGRAAKGVAKTFKNVLVKGINKVIDEVNRLADGDRDKLLTSGARVGSAVNEKKTTEPLKLFKAYNGINLGDIIVQAIAGTGTTYVRFQFALAKTEAEITTWTEVRRKGIKTLLAGLPSGSRIWVRAISVGPRSQEVNSLMITTIVL